MAATFLGCLLIYTLPDWVSAQINKQMPYWFYEREVCAHISVMPMVCAKQCSRARSSDIFRIAQAYGLACAHDQSIALRMRNATINFYGWTSYPLCVLQQTLLTVGTAISNWIMSSYFR